MVDTLEANLGEYGYAGQLQQRPAPIGGGLIKTSYFKLWPAKDPLPDFTFVIQSYDTAFTESTLNDPTACTVWGVFEKDKRKCVLLLDFWTEHMDYPALRQRLIDDWSAKYGGQRTIGITGKKVDHQLHPARSVDLVIVENKGSGISLIQDLRRANIGAMSFNPGKADKVSRAIQASPLLEAGNCYVLESGKEPGRYITWARPFIKELELFPAGDRDDAVDSWSQTFLYLRDSALMALPSAPLDYENERDYEAEKQSDENPYLA
jgi:predicted phage terminase large subunit-like protein